MGCRMKKLVENHWYRGSSHFHSKNVGEPIECSRCLPLPCFNKFILTQKNYNCLVRDWSAMMYDWLTKSTWSAMMHYLVSVYNSYERNFSSREFWGIFKLKKVCITQKKKTSPTCFNTVFWKALRKKDVLPFDFSKKKLFGTLPPLLNKPIGFSTKLLEKQFKDSP